MREYVLYMWIGVWLFLLPFFGIPGSWKDGLFILTALFIVVHSFIGYRRARPAEEGEVGKPQTVVEVDIETVEITEK